MGDISKHFSRSEFACKCGCGYNTVDAQLLAILEDLRETVQSPITITSGCRCAAHNAREGGAKNSQHLYGRAADIAVQGVSPGAVYELLNRDPRAGGVGVYTNWVHVDTRNEPFARWDQRK